jgi:hypothetical protein
MGGKRGLADSMLGEVVCKFHVSNNRKTQRGCQQENSLILGY